MIRTTFVKAISVIVGGSGVEVEKLANQHVEDLGHKMNLISNIVSVLKYTR
jgi:hypothetical protein